MSSITSERLIEKRTQLAEALGSLANQISEAQQQLQQLNESYSINRGALLQLNDLLTELGVDIESIDSARNGTTPTAESVDTTAVGSDEDTNITITEDIGNTTESQNL